MKLFKTTIAMLLIGLSTASLQAQRTEITISFSEQFFDALLDAVFQHAAPPEFSLAGIGSGQLIKEGRGIGAGDRDGLGGDAGSVGACNESIRLLRETDGVRTAVRFRDGKIIAPIAFTGQYNPPLVGCVAFSGWAEAVITLQFDTAGQRLVANARAEKVSLSGTGGIGSALVGRMVQGTIDKKINPIEIIRTDKVTFLLPLQNSNSVRMKATGFRHDLLNGALNVRIAYEFEKVR